MRKLSGRSILILAALLFAACDEDGTTGPSSIVETVAVIPGIVPLVAGDTVRLTVLARSAIGAPLVGRAVTWTSSTTSVANVSATGVVTAVGAGSATITATVDGVIGTATVTVSPHFAAASFASVATGGAHTCALTATGAAYCWGRGEAGQLGVPPPVNTCLADLIYPCNLVPVPVDGNLTFRQLAAGSAHTCGLTSDGSVYCWGSNSNGQLGDSSTTNRNAPVAVATTVKFASIDAGSDHTCGLTSSGTAYCWGINSRGQLGDSTTTRRLTPVAVTGGRTFKQLVAGGTGFGGGHTCALTSAGEPFCWGINTRGQLGRSPRTNLPAPVPMPVSGGFTFTTLATGLSDHVCGLTSTGAAHCWGGNTNGELGDGTRGDSPLPVAVSGSIAFATIVTGGYGEGGHTCGLTSAGVAYCWGENERGSVGDSSYVDRTTPTLVAGGLTFATLDSGFRHTCARATGGALYCWGSGRTGQLGTNATSSINRPVKVAGQP